MKNETSGDRGHSVMQLLLVLVAIVVLLSLLTVGELWLLQAMGFDVVAELKASRDAGGASFVFHAMGAVAFVLAQPILLLWIVVRATSKLAPLLTNLTSMVMKIG